MITDLKPYAEYKESGLPWLGQVPGHWEVRRIKTVLRETDRRTTDGVGTLLSLTRVRGLIPHHEMTDKMHSAKTLVGYKCYADGQLVMNRMQAWSGMFGAGPTHGLVSPDYAVFDVLRGNSVKFLLERLKAPDLVGQFALESKGIGSGFNRLYTDRFGPIPIPLPPPAEQAAIVRFLDWANGRLERAIRAKRKVIALLNEQKQAIIHRAVTRGLDPSVPLKDSGVPWLGKIPKHWEVIAAKRACSMVRDGTHLPPPRTESGFPLLSVRNVINGRLVRRDDDSRISASDFQSLNKSFDVRVGDIMLAVVGATLGKVAIVEDIGPFQIQRSLGILRPRPGVLMSQYLAQYLRSPQLQQHLWRSVAFSAQPGIYLSFVSNLPIPLPPSVTEQDDLCDAIDAATQPIEAGISRLEREITLLREYRTRLVSDVVTGKLDVRAAAAALPDEAPLDDATASDDDDALDTDDLTDAEADA